MPRRLLTVIDNQTIAISGDYTSVAFEIPKKHSRFALSWVITGDGSAKFEALTSLDAIQYNCAATPIASDQTSSSGPETDGKDEIQVSLRPCTSVKIKCSETGATSNITVTAKLLSME